MIVTVCQSIKIIYLFVCSIKVVVTALQFLFLEPNMDNCISIECLPVLYKTKKFVRMVRKTMDGGYFFGVDWPRTLLSDENCDGKMRKRCRNEESRGLAKRRRSLNEQDDDDGSEMKMDEVDETSLNQEYIIGEYDEAPLKRKGESLTLLDTRGGYCPREVSPSKRWRTAK